MALEMYVLSSRQLRSIDEWQRAADDLQFPIKLSNEVEFHRVRGFLPVLWKGRSTGFECDHWSSADIAEVIAEHRIDPNLKYVLAFRWGGDFNELVAALQAAAAYATATEGVVFDCEEGKVDSAIRTVQIARETEVALPQMEAALKEIRSKK